MNARYAAVQSAYETVCELQTEQEAIDKSEGWVNEHLSVSLEKRRQRLGSFLYKWQFRIVKKAVA